MVKLLFSPGIDKKTTLPLFLSPRPMSVSRTLEDSFTLSLDSSVKMTSRTMLLMPPMNKFSFTKSLPFKSVTGSSLIPLMLITSMSVDYAQCMLNPQFITIGLSFLVTAFSLRKLITKLFSLIVLIHLLVFQYFHLIWVSSSTFV